MSELKNISNAVRRTIVELAHGCKGPHVGSALSCADILTVLYFDVLRLQDWERRDIFILSKAHAAMSLYATLAESGILDRALLQGYCRNEGDLPAHLDRFSAKGVEISAGSLGHGFNMGLGLAYAFKKQDNGRKVFVVVGDGETQEGSIWEGALFAPTLGLDNFTVIVDYNNLQGYGRPNELCSFTPLKEKWQAFGWHAIEVDGHDHAALGRALREDTQGKPRALIARTTKGKGVSFMEDQLIWHYYIVTDEHKARAFEELQ
ncbi:MAG TPA: transketolase [Novimethylophilus sp.]|jgi:transketolase|uniref:transketolase n=1 Tax=Novimethylophilus sp. TaxID=2137426 RepID=UPI002F429824